MGMMPLFAVVPDDARPFPMGATNRVLTAVEYFVDTDPGPGSGTAINPEDVAYDEATESIATLSISPSAIPNGSRRIGVRARDELGNWSPATYLDLSVVDLTLVEGQPYDVQQVDHLAIAQLPSVGSVVKVTLAGATYSYEVKQGDDLAAVRSGLKSALAGNPTVNATILGDGRIKLTALQSVNSYAVSLTVPGGTVQQTKETDFPERIIGLASHYLTGAEYFVDNDPGAGAGTPINPEDLTHNEATEGIGVLSLDAMDIPNGFRRIGLRARDELGNWSPVSYIEVNVVDLTLVEHQPQAEPSVDHLTISQMPSVGTTLSVNLVDTTASYKVVSGNNLSAVRSGLTAAFANNPIVSAELLGDGRIKLTAKQAGREYALSLSAGITAQRTQQQLSYFPAGAMPTTRRLVAAEYFVDTDPGAGNGIMLDPEDTAFDEATEGIAPLSLTVDDVLAGARTLGIRLRDESGNWSSPRLFNFGAEDPGQYAPHRVEVTPGEIAENLAPGVWSGTLKTFDWNDPGGNGSYTYALVSGGVSDNQYFNLSNDTLTVNQAFDYEQKPFLQLRVRTTDNTSKSLETLIKIPVINDDTEDEDGDGLNQRYETFAGTRDNSKDSDGDGFNDDIEESMGASPSYKYSFPNWAPTITSNGGGATASIDLAEGQTAVTTVVATDSDGDPLTYVLAGGADVSKFTINNSSGVLALTINTDHEAPVDTGANNTYVVKVRAMDGTKFDEQIITVRVTNINEPPVITSNGGASSVSLTMAENDIAVATLVVADLDGPSLTYSFSGGVIKRSSPLIKRMVL